MYNVIHTKDVFTVLCSSLVSKPTLDKEKDPLNTASHF